MILLDPRFWFGLVIAAACGYLGGCQSERNSHAKEQAKAVQAARETEQDIRRMQDRATVRYLDRMLEQQEKARALPHITLPADCPVPADAGRVLNDAQGMPSDAGNGSSAGAARPEVDSTCSVELDIAKRNYAEVCIPNAEQLTELQKRWEEVRSLLNQKGATRP
jgi:hypothetical protein